MKNTFGLVNNIIYLLVIFLFPLFFLPFTQDFFITNKFYLLTVSSLLLLLFSVIRFIITQKITWKKTPFDVGLFLLILTMGLSLIISSPNRVQALINQNFGLVMILSLIILYYYSLQIQVVDSKNKLVNFLGKITPLQAASFSGIVLSIITLFLFFNPLKSISLPQSLAFLKNPGLTPLGNQLDLALFLGFFLILQIAKIIIQQPPEKSLRAAISQIFSVLSTLSILIALAVSVYAILKPTNQPAQLPNLLLPPYRLSWYTAVEILKNPITALFGVGIDNFSAIFTRVKDAGYNLSNLWQINSFVVGRSAILHVFTEIGIFGLVALGILLVKALREISALKAANQSTTLLYLGFLYLVIWFIFFSPSLTLFFLFFLMLTLIAKNSLASNTHEQTAEEPNYFSLELSYQALDVGIVIVAFILFIASGYLIGRTYTAEVYFKKSLDGLLDNNLVELYKNQRQAIILNKYIERYRINFSQVNYLIAKNIIADKKKEELSNENKKQIIEAVQAAITEAKATVNLNQQKAANWANLADIYRNIVNVIQGADVWTVSAYQRAIIADPQNPNYRFNLGSFYYSLGNYDEALRLFEQSVAVKPDWSNAYYNLAWAAYQKKDYQRAVNEMQNVLNTIDKKQFQKDYEKAQTDLEEFKKKMSENSKETSKTQIETTSPQLNLPTPPNATFTPRIRLPKENEASPEAK